MISSEKELLEYIDGKRFIQIHYRVSDTKDQVGRPNLGRVDVGQDKMGFVYTDRDQMLKVGSEYDLPTWTDFIGKEKGNITFKQEIPHKGFTTEIVWYEA